MILEKWQRNYLLYRRQAGRLLNMSGAPGRLGGARSWSQKEEERCCHLSRPVSRGDRSEIKTGSENHWRGFPN